MYGAYPPAGAYYPAAPAHPHPTAHHHPPHHPYPYYSHPVATATPPAGVGHYQSHRVAELEVAVAEKERVSRRTCRPFLQLTNSAVTLLCVSLARSSRSCGRGSPS